MINESPDALTHHRLTAAEPKDRPALVEAYIIATVAAVIAPRREDFDGSTRLAELGLDSLQAVEVKFALDQVVGIESDVMLIISNPTIRDLARDSLRDGGL